MDQKTQQPVTAAPEQEIPPVREEKTETAPQAQPCGENTVLKKPNGKTGKRLIAALVLVLLLAAAAVVFALFVNRFALSLRLLGEQELLVDYGGTYMDPGAEPVIRGTLLLQNGITPQKAEMEIQSDVDTGKLGKYTVTYTARYLWLTATAQRNVRVADTQCPVITLVDESGATILPGQHYEEEGYTAVDNVDGDITDRVIRTEDMGVITYAVMDSSGNPAYAERKIPYYDPIPPEILLTGEETMTISAGTVFEDPGFTAHDNADGDITDRVETEGEVVWYVPGTYTLSYCVSDVYGNETMVQRTVEVTAVPRPETDYPGRKAIYLTFDDGPGPHTGRLLDVLKKYGVKATFFVVDTGYNGTMWRIVNEGHSIGIHTMTHDYNSIYASPEAFFADLYGMQEIIYQNTGVRTTLMRFPGGGSNLVSSYNKGIMTTLTEAVQDAGFQYFDWNVDSMDAGGAKNKADVAYYVSNGVLSHPFSVVLQHDTHSFSVDAVEDLILWGLDNGYTFLPIKPESPGVHHTVQN